MTLEEGGVTSSRTTVNGFLMKFHRSDSREFLYHSITRHTLRSDTRSKLTVLTSPELLGHRSSSFTPTR